MDDPWLCHAQEITVVRQGVGRFQRQGVFTFNDDLLADGDGDFFRHGEHEEGVRRCKDEKRWIID